MKVTCDLHTSHTRLIDVAPRFPYDPPERVGIKIFRNIYNDIFRRFVLYLGQCVSPLRGIDAGVYLLHPTLQVFLSDMGILF
jgi:hypothetical protein